MHKGPKADIYADHSVDRDGRCVRIARQRRAVSLPSAPWGEICGFRVNLRRRGCMRVRLTPDLLERLECN
jgi:hypothetical protein